MATSQNPPADTCTHAVRLPKSVSDEVKRIAKIEQRSLSSVLFLFLKVGMAQYKEMLEERGTATLLDL